MKIINGGLGLILSLWLCAAQAQTVFSIRNQETPGDKRENYNKQLIQLALDKTRRLYGNYRLEQIPPMNTPRSLYAAAQNIYPNLLLELSYDPALLDKDGLSYIPFPVDLGMVGYRVCFVNPAVKDAVARVRNLADLRQFTIGQGVGWVDTQILRYNGLKVEEVSNYTGLFRMVAAGRIDLFCRGINEVSNELQSFGDITNLEIDAHLLLVYPLPRFYYLGTQNPSARSRVELGLQLAYQDGSLLALWRQHFLAGILALRLDKRLVISLQNPLLGDLDNHYLKYDIDPLNLPSEH